MTRNQKYGSWAVVTGASYGIGHEFARQLAEQGMNLVLVARSQDKLNAVAADLRQQHGVEVKSLSLDLTERDFVAQLHPALKGLDVGLVVSNAGAAAMGAFLDREAGQLASMLRLNVLAQMEVAHYFGRRFKERAQGGGILLLSSTAALQGVPYSGNYSAAKAYILNLGEALNYELRSFNVDVTVVLPGPTSTPGLNERDDVDFSKVPMPPMTTAAVVSGSLNALQRNKPRYIPGLMNQMMAGMTKRMFSRSLSTNMWGGLMRRAMAGISG